MNSDIGDGTVSSGIAELISSTDPERWLAVTYAPRAAQPALAGLFALDISLGRVVASTSEPMIGAMRLAWWREALVELHLPAVPAEPVLQALKAAFVGGDAGIAAELAAMTDGWLALIEVEQLDCEAMAAHGRERGERLFALAAKVLAPAADSGGVRKLGRGWALADLAGRLSQAAARAEAAALAAEALAGPFPALPRKTRPLVALAALARRDAKAGMRRQRAGSPARQLRMLLALMTGR